MKKLFLVICAFVMTTSLSSFKEAESLKEVSGDCMSQAWQAGSDAEDMGFDSETVYNVTDFVYEACINGRDYQLLMISN